MLPIKNFASNLTRAIAITAFAAAFLLPSTIEARVLSGSVTERKTNRKITSMLKSAQKNYDSGKVKLALDTYWKILELDPSETFAYLELGEIYLALKIYDRAIELLQPGLNMAEREMDRDTICYYYSILTQAHLGLNQTGEANKALIKAAEASPKNPMPRMILGDIYLANNRIADAFKAYKKAIELDPDYQPAKEKLGELTANYSDQIQSRPNDKKAISEKAVKLPPVQSRTVKIIKEPQTHPGNEKAQPASASAFTPEDIAIPLPANLKNQPETTIKVNNTPETVEKKETDATLVQAGSPNTVPPEITASETPAKPISERPVPVAANSTKTDATASASKPVSADIPTPDASQISEQVDKLLAGTAEEKKEATSFFVSLEEKGINAVEELLYDSDPEVRIIAIRILPEFKSFSPRVKTMLNDAMEDPDPAVLAEIADAMKSLGN